MAKKKDKYDEEKQGWPDPKPGDQEKRLDTLGAPFLDGEGKLDVVSPEEVAERLKEREKGGESNEQS